MTRCLARLRKAVQAPPTAPVIETRHRQGYRFVAEVTVLAQTPSPAPGETAPLQAAAPVVPPVSPDTPVPPAPVRPAASEAERRQLTVMFCDVVDSTTLAGRLDPEDFRAVMVRYHATCTEVIQRYGGHMAQYLGDGLLVYFGWPQAHEDDARRAIHAGLALVTAVQEFGPELAQDYDIRLAVRIGIHTGLVVVGTGREGTPYGQLAVGATPNLAATMQSLAVPDTVVISAATFHLVQGYFVCELLGEHLLPGASEPSALYQVRQASEARGRLDLTTPPHRTPFVGREAELAVLRERVGQVRQGMGQVMLLSGEAGIGKSRLVQEVTTTYVADGFARIECHCSPYYQHTALHPVSEWLQRSLLCDSDTPVPERIARLEALVQQARLDGQESLPLLASLLHLVLPEGRYPALQLTPQQQRQRTLDTLLALVLELAHQQPVLLIVEDLHWIDPTTLEWLGLVIDQGPTAPLCTLLTCRPTFASPWSGRTHVTLLTVPRLTSPQVAQMVQWLRGEQLPAAQVQAEAALALCTEHAFALQAARGSVLLGVALATQGHCQEGRQRMHEEFEALRALRAEFWLPGLLALALEVHHKAGNHEEAQALLAEALTIIDTTAMRSWAAELYRLKGECLLAQALPNMQAAGTYFQQALDLARQQQAKLFELRAAMSLSRLWHRQG